MLIYYWASQTVRQCEVFFRESDFQLFYLKTKPFWINWSWCSVRWRSLGLCIHCQVNTYNLCPSVWLFLTTDPLESHYNTIQKLARNYIQIISLFPHIKLEIWLQVSTLHQQFVLLSPAAVPDVLGEVRPEVGQDGGHQVVVSPPQQEIFPPHCQPPLLGYQEVLQHFAESSPSRIRIYM